jgi:hypothetical protein
MTEERFIEIMKDEDSPYVQHEMDDTLLGLNLIAKYLPDKGVEAAEHDIIYSVSAETIITAGITEEDAKLLRSYHWGYNTEVDSLYTFV